MNLTPGGNHINTKQLNDDLVSTAAAAFSHLFLYCLCLREKEKKGKLIIPDLFFTPPLLIQLQTEVAARGSKNT